MAPSSADLVLNPATRVLWRDAHTIQLELGAQAVVLDGVESADVRRLLGPGRRPDPAADPPEHCGGPPSDALAALAAGGFLVPRGRPEPPPVPRLATELGALRIRRGGHAGAVLAARHEAAVSVQGVGRVAPLVAALLAAAGVGRVHVVGSGDVHLAQAAPGGVLPADEGCRYARAAATAVRRAAPECDTSAPPPGRVPELTVVVLDAPVATEARAALHARGCPHLAVQVDGDRGVVGPLVVPGLTGCLHCADLHRLDRDAAWPALAVQLTTPRRHAASDVSLAGLTASLATLQALAYLDGEPVAAVDGTLEAWLPDWRVRRRSFPAHPDCECGAYAGLGGWPAPARAGDGAAPADAGPGPAPAAAGPGPAE